MDKLQNILALWKKHFLTLYGKSYTCIVKSVGFSTSLYAFNVLHVPECVITNAEKAIWDLIWDGKSDKVKRDVGRRHRSAEY